MSDFKNFTYINNYNINMRLHTRFFVTFILKRFTTANWSLTHSSQKSNEVPPKGKYASTATKRNTIRPYADDFERNEWFITKELYSNFGTLLELYSNSYSNTAGVDQQQNVMTLMKILKFGGFFRDESGLNNLPSLRVLNQILNLKDNLTFELVDDQIESFCSKSKFF